MKALEKMGLVELDGASRSPDDDRGLPDADEIDAILQSTGVSATPAPSPAPAPAPVAAVAVPTGTELDLAQVYAQAGVPSSPFPAEKLLKLLEGLRAMDPHTRKVAVQAMDAADESWTIDDPVMDAQRKTDALRRAKEGVNQRLVALSEQAQAQVAAEDAYQTQASETIRQQIRELEDQLQAEIQQVAERKASLREELRGAQDEASHQILRIDQEIERLHEVMRSFGAPAATPPPSTGG